jgi:hypothetical protein
MPQDQGPPFKHYAALICKDRKDYIKHVDALIFMAERNQHKGIIATFAADADSNFIINGVKYIHPEDPIDLNGKYPVAYFFVGDWEKNPRNRKLYNFAKQRTRIYGKMLKTPLQMVNPKKLLTL